MFNLAFPNVFDLESSFCITYYTLKVCFIGCILGNAALRYSGVNGRSYLLDMNILMGLGKGDRVDKSEDLRGKKTRFF